jgi:uncharacterized protein YkwD
MRYLLFLLLLQQGKPEIRIPDLEQRLSALINVERRNEGLPDLVLDSGLSGLARAHSEDMAKRGYFKHNTPEGRTPRQRLTAEGYSCTTLFGENIFQDSLYFNVTMEGKRITYRWKSLEEIAAGTVKAWMNSADHRSNLLGKFEETGIGIATGPNDKLFITEIFCGNRE